MRMNMNDTMKMSVSSIYQKNGRKMISVLFTDGDKSAEGRVPEGKIYMNKGFSPKEIAALEFYLKKEEKAIVDMAKGVSVMGAFMGKRRQ